MLGPAALATFTIAALAVVVAPGPDTLYTVTSSLEGGPSAGVVAGAGTATGVLVHTIAAILGLSAVLRTSAVAYTAVTYVGAAYLASLGVRMRWNDEAFDPESAVGGADRSLPDTYRRAATINVTNPKVAVFVLAFLPQFVRPGGAATVHLTLLGTIYAGLSLAYLAVVAVFAGGVRHRLLGADATRRLVRYASGSVLLGFAATLALERRPGS